MALKLFDSLTRNLRELQPSHPDGVFRFYNCGPTVYAPAHIGNFRTFVVNDILRRMLELEFGAPKVKHVRNLTDVDDKTIKRARDEGRPLADVTRQWTDKFHADCAALNCLPPHIEPTATGHIREQVDMIDCLMQKGNAYRAADGSVYFKVSSFSDYGRLSRVKERELQIGSALAGKSQAVDADEKEDGSDFALWKAHKPDDGENSWDSPWGRGRPGWHIECSAMSKKHLGETIDLHTGGVDLLFPHHENEIAQSECCNGVQFSRHWYHSEHLLVDGKKMSKSLGNLYTLDDLKQKGFSPMAVRYALLSGHPRKQLNFTLDSLHAAEKALATLRAYRATLAAGGAAHHVFAPVIAALEDDLNTPAALGALFTIVNRGKGEADVESFDRVMFALGLKLDAPTAPKAEVPAEVTALAEKRWAAKQAKDFATADALRKEIAAAGWSMLDRKDGYSLEPAKK
ncbi:cysteine--tRNA ligase [Opitutus terrae]|uniref:Cysteine--tRNA ligase n=1 Tax=Opitutus terrae (strain DSM 11246 / JCM 15787 / PB90-1) TaxID=452637 RepID=SYC_OPITP|nr:cysteine--tRNA ligase [Opitutus terrae]B1ZSX8.1 RecName: Full=Cysteine--tRNA ligase; AltName: Full=Cysteinyl-tRNA synthetase; Short=CysRS [Opitutus terrae PB90-1]ACB75767.1 cysteinyl-tRNA synthetase [Opitutus terrae PB90-1]